jgi:CheY-like chemotaxis protein
VPGPETVRYGGNTPCVEIMTDDGTLLIFDCGTGARNLGARLARAGVVRAHVFIGHTHSDHIQGLPFMMTGLMPGSQLTIYGPTGIDRSFSRAVSGHMDYAYFPVPIEHLPVQVQFQDLGEGEFAIGKVKIRTQYLNHTAPCLAFRIETGGATVVYATDHEPNAELLWGSERRTRLFTPGAMLHPSDARHAEFLEGADLVIHDAQYIASEYAQKVGWGHSTVEYAVDVAIAAMAQRLALFHYDPTRSDVALDRILEAATRRASASGSGVEVLGAREGLEVHLTESEYSVAAACEPRAPLPLSHPRILVAENDDAVAETLQCVLEDDGYELRRAADGREALHLLEREAFDLVVLDLALPEVSGHDVCRAIRGAPRSADLPILVVTVRNDPKDIRAAFAAGVNDYMVKPFSEAQLRARVRSWVMRRGSLGLPASGPHIDRTLD